MLYVLIHLHKKGLDIYQNRKIKQNEKYQRNVYFNTGKSILWWVNTIWLGFRHSPIYRILLEFMSVFTKTK